MKTKKAYNVPFAKLPDFNRKAITDLLISDKITNRVFLIDHPFLYSHDSDVEAALDERFNHEWGKREYAAAVRVAEQLQEYLPGDANSIFKRRFKLAMRDVRIHANMEIARCWVRLLKHRPEYVKRCPWHFFQGDRIWQTLQDEAFLKAIKCTPLQVARKMNLNAMSAGDWDEVLKIVPELASRRPKNDYVCIVE